MPQEPTYKFNIGDRVFDSENHAAVVIARFTTHLKNIFCYVLEYPQHEWECVGYGWDDEASQWTTTNRLVWEESRLTLITEQEKPQ
jgi:hypothetical protein